MAEHLLEVRGLRTQFPMKDGLVKAVDGVDLHVDRGETLGIVGESGSGKSMTVLSLLRLLPRPGRVVAGEILYQGRDLTRASDQEMQEVRGAEIAMIAMGLTTAPSVLIADEPTTALDVTIQAQILELLKQVNREFGTATILITHNLGVVAGMCERVMVMYAGRVVEEGPTEDVFGSPKHPYTWSLLQSIPRLDAEEHDVLRAIEGMPPDLTNLPSGCAFHPRCPFRVERCVEQTPALAPVGRTQRAACWVTQAGVELG